MSTPRRIAIDTTPWGLLRLYYRITLITAAAVLALQLLLHFLLTPGKPLTFIELGFYAVLLVLCWIGIEVSRLREGTIRRPRGLYLGLVGLLTVVLVVETGGLSSPYYMLLFTTAVFAALVLAPSAAFLLTSVLSALYAGGVWLYPAKGLLAGGLEAVGRALGSGREMRTEEVTGLAMQVSFLYVGTWVAMRLARGFRQEVVRLEADATRDPLTGLPNRRGFMEKLGLEMRRASQLDWPISMLVVDLDHFKRVNDRFGHGVGDEALAAAAQILREAAGPLDHLARLGGEEFAVAAVGADPGHGADLADRVLRAFRDHPWDQIRPGVKVTCSIGVAMLQPGQRGAGTEDLSHLLAEADQALMLVKQNGRDGYLLAGQPTSAIARNRRRDPESGQPRSVPMLHR